MKRILGWIAGGLLVGFLVFWILPDFWKAAPLPGSDEFLRQEAAKLNDSLPAQIDERTELTATEAAPGTLIYKYRLVTIDADRVDAAGFAKSAKAQLVQSVCTRPETGETREQYLKKGVTLRYSYYDNANKPVATIDVMPADCGF